MPLWHLTRAACTRALIFWFGSLLLNERKQKCPTRPVAVTALRARPARAACARGLRARAARGVLRCAPRPSSIKTAAASCTHATTQVRCARARAARERQRARLNPHTRGAHGTEPWAGPAHGCAGSGTAAHALCLPLK
jgi:hypothetical protein